MLDKNPFGVWKFMKTDLEVWCTKHVFEKFAKMDQLQALLFQGCKPQMTKPSTSKLYIFSIQSIWTLIWYHLYFLWDSYGHLKLDFFTFQCLWSKVTYNVASYHMLKKVELTHSKQQSWSRHIEFDCATCKSIIS